MQLGYQAVIDTKFEYKRDRSATLSLNNNQITEVLGSEIVVGTGYKFAKVKLPFDKIPASAVNVRFDFSFRDNVTVIRKIVETQIKRLLDKKWYL